MARSHCCFDIGSETIKMAEFAVEKDSITLNRFAVASLAVRPDTPLDARHSMVASTIRSMLDDHNVRPRSISVSISGQSVFTRFVKLPAVEESKVSQIIKYEAQQQVPFPIEEVEWDHQVIANGSSEELDIVLVAVKNDLVRGLLEALQRQRLEVDVVDVSPLALYNCVKHVEDSSQQTITVIDFGARTTNLIMYSGRSLWSRTIPIGGESITSQIAKETGLDMELAERLKRAAWVNAASVQPPKDAPEDTVKVSEIVTNIMSRLLAEIRRSIGFYRTQAREATLRQLLLCGGGAQLKHLDAYLSEKLKLEVRVLDPMRGITVAPSVDRQGLNRVAHLLGDVIGLGLRQSGQAQIQVNLLPKAVAQQRELSRKKLFLVGSGVLVIAAVALLIIRTALATSSLSSRLTTLRELRDTRQGLKEQIASLQNDIAGTEKKAEEIQKLQDARLYWVDFITVLKKKKPKYAWFTEIQLVGTETGAAASRAPTRGFYGPTSPYMPYGGGYSSMPMGPRMGGATGAAGPPGTVTTGKTRVMIKGYLKIPKPTGNPTLDIANQIEDLRTTLENQRERDALKKAIEDLKGLKEPRVNDRELNSILQKLAENKRTLISEGTNYVSDKKFTRGNLEFDPTIAEQLEAIERARAETAGNDLEAVKTYKGAIDIVRTMFVACADTDYFRKLEVEELKPLKSRQKMAKFSLIGELNKPINF